MSEKPHVTVIYQEVKTAPSAGAILAELVVFLVLVGLVGLVGGCTMLL